MFQTNNTLIVNGSFFIWTFLCLTEIYSTNYSIYPERFLQIYTRTWLWPIAEAAASLLWSKENPVTLLHYWSFFLVISAYDILHQTLLLPLTFISEVHWCSFLRYMHLGALGSSQTSLRNLSRTRIFTNQLL